MILFYMVNGFLKYYVLRLSGPKNRKRSTLAAIIAGLPVTLFVLQSIGQLTLRDTITLIILTFILCFYVARFSFLQI